MYFLYRICQKSSITVGRALSCDISISNMSVSRLHFRLVIDATGNSALVFVIGKNGISIDGCLLGTNSKSNIGKGTMIRVSDVSFLWLGEYLYVSSNESVISNSKDIYDCSSILRESPQANLADGIQIEGGYTNSKFVPSIRTTPRLDLSPIEIEAPPSRRVPEKPTFMLAVGPALTMAIPMLLGCGRTLSILTSLFAAFWAASNIINRQAKIRNEERRRRNSYISYIEECEERIKQRIDNVTGVWKANFPQIEEYLKGGGNPFLIWNKGEEDEERDSIRLGIGVRQFPVDIVIPKERFATIDDSLKEMPEKLKEKYLYIENVPIAINLSKVRSLGFIYDSKQKLIYVLNAFLVELCLNYQPKELSISFIISDSEINKFFIRQNYLPHVQGVDSDKSLVITDNPHILVNLLNENNWVVLLQTRLEQLPSYIDEVMIIQKNFQGLMTSRLNQNKRINVKFDGLNPIIFREYSRMISKLAGLCMTESAIPEKVEFNDLFDKIKKEEVLDKWDKACTFENISIPIGIGYSNRKIFLNLHEKSHGPHGIVAGTTGSGKSELLSTMILSASLCFPPDQLGFCLIDYKGGGMSSLFALSPHLLGSISNLSVHESRRAMIALRSEIIRRQNVFLECGVNNISDYTRGYKSGKFSGALPHILVVIDEFAELKKEQPDFMMELISLAAVGRSLGFHLILATQKPAGVVDGKIRSNSKFRICLRVEDKSDSEDMLKKSDAAYITNCGRAYIQVGNDEVYELFQSGYTGGKVTKCEERTIKIYDENFVELNNINNENAEQDLLGEESWFSYSLKEIIEANKEYKGKRPPPLWQSPLPSMLFYQMDSKSIALIDDPENQRYMELDSLLDNPKHICIIGPSQSGKSVFLRSFIISMLSADGNYEIYIIDMGGKLEIYANCNCVGGYIGREHKKRIPMLLLFLKDELSYRRQNGYEKEMFLVLDNYSEAMESFEDMAEDIFEDILKYGKSAGIITVTTAIGVGNKELPGRFLDGFDIRIILGEFDGYFAAGIMKCQLRDLPLIENNPGRGIIKLDDRVLCLQIRILDDANEISRVIKCENARKLAKARGYPYVPDNVTIEEVLNKIPDVIKENISSKEVMNLPIGFIEETGRIYELPFDKASCIQIFGEKGTGRKTLIEAICIIAAYFNIDTVKVESFEVLLGLIKHETYNGEIVIIDLEKVLEKYSESSFSKMEEEQISKFFDNSVKKSKKYKFIVNVSDQIRIKFQNTIIYESLIKNPYVICMGGGLDEIRMYDFSYLPYSQQAKKLPVGHGVVRRFNNKNFYGNVIFPKMIWQEDE